MDKLKLLEVLRYGLAGAIAVGALLLRSPQAVQWMTAHEKLCGAAPLAVVVFTVGALVYTLHRALIYPIAYRVLGAGLALLHREWTWWYVLPYHPAPPEVKAAIRRWREDQAETSLYHNLREWAAQVHFLYCATWSILLAIGFSAILPLPQGHASAQAGSSLSFTSWAWVVIIGAAVVHHYRFLCFERRVASLTKE